MEEIEDQRRSNSESENDQVRTLTSKIAELEQEASEAKEEIKTLNADLEAKVKEVDA